MAVYVFINANGRLHSWLPQNISVAQAQAQGLLASNADLAAQDMGTVDALPPLDATHSWDETQKTVVSVAAPKSTVPLQVFWKRFTAAEREAIEGLNFTGTQAQKNAVNGFWRYVESAGHVDCNDSYVQQKVTQLEGIGILAAGRAAEILV